VLIIAGRCCTPRGNRHLICPGKPGRQTLGNITQPHHQHHVSRLPSLSLHNDRPSAPSRRKKPLRSCLSYTSGVVSSPTCYNAVPPLTSLSGFHPYPWQSQTHRKSKVSESSFISPSLLLFFHGFRRWTRDPDLFDPSPRTCMRQKLPSPRNQLHGVVLYAGASRLNMMRQTSIVSNLLVRNTDSCRARRHLS
jgi:hypothetical protein